MCISYLNSNSFFIFINMNLCTSLIKIVFLVGCFFFVENVNVLAQDYSLKIIRELFNEAVKNEASRDEFCELMEAQPEKEPILMAYKGSAKALEAKEGWNPLSRIGHLKDADRLFEKAIEKEPKNIEIRFLRFSVQYYIPKWLGLSDNLDEDKSVIVKNIQDYKKLNIDEGVLDWIQDFMIDSGYCSQSEIATIRAAKAN